MRKTFSKKVVSILLICTMLFGLIPPVKLLAASTLTITFNQNYADAPANTTQNIELGSVLKSELLPTPTRQNYIFAGWYTTSFGNLQHKAYSVTQKINTNTTFYAHWIADDHVRWINTTEGDKTVKLGISLSSGVKIRKISDNTEVVLTITKIGEENFINNEATLSYGVYKDLDGNRALTPYENWTLPVTERSINLASLLTPEEIAGLMLYSGHQTEWGTKATDTSFSVPTSAQVTFLSNDDLRHVLIAGTGNTAKIHATWNNSTQAMVENFGKGIPSNNSSDPRHSAAIGAEFYSNNNGTMSIWPTSLGLAATFNPDTMFQFAKIASAEYRAFGISTALSPQIDISTDPRWNRTSGTFGEDPLLSANMAAAYVKGFQGSYDDNISASDKNGTWGFESVNAMIKHWPGGGAGESGKDAHNDFGKYAVYPGANFQAHMIPFVDGSLGGEQGSIDVATAVMPYYTISNNVDPSGKDLANGFSEYMLTDLLVGKYNFDGVICTDWGVDATRGWGPSIEDMDITERSYELIMAGVNQFGGRNSSKFILEARDIAVSKGTEAQFDNLMDISASKLLLNGFKTGLFENPYLDIDKSTKIATDEDSNNAGVDAQVEAIVTLKNITAVKNLLASDGSTKVYVPKNDSKKYIFTNIGIDTKRKFVYEDNPALADLAIVPLGTPTNPGAPDLAFFGGGWAAKDDDRYVTKGYFPLTLQYSEYTAVDSRAVSLAGDYRDLDVAVSPKTVNRTYKDKKATATNFSAFKVLMDTKEMMGEKPVVAVLNIDNPTVMTEIDSVSDVVLGRFACSDAAVLEILTGAKNTTAMLPLQFPASMKAVEKQFEDVPRDLDVYVDSVGNAYDFGYGLTWNDSAYKKIDATVNPGYGIYVNNGSPISPLTEPQSDVNNGIDDFVKFSTVTLPVGSVGKTYLATIKTQPSNAKITLLRVEQTTAQQKNGTPASLPSGIKFTSGNGDGSALFSGIPTKSGVVQVVLKASDGNPAHDRTYRLNLMIGKTPLVVNPDPNALSIQLTLASAKGSNYAKEEYSKFLTAFDAAKVVYKKATVDFSATQSEIDKATYNLRTAREALKGKVISVSKN